MCSCFHFLQELGIDDDGFVAYVLRKTGVRTYWPYVLVGGAMSWTGLHHAHLHPALALVFVVPFLPAATEEHKRIFEDDPRDRSPLARFEHEWKVIVDFGLFMFSLANAGVQFASMGTVTFIVFGSLLIGKACGIFCFGWLAARLGFDLPCSMKLRELLIVGIIAGTGFTVALFVAGEAFSDPAVTGAAKMGAMLSIFASVIALIVGRLVGVAKKP